MKQYEKWARRISVILCEGFTLITIAMMPMKQEFSRLLLACTTVILVLLPEMMERLFRCRFSLPLYLFGVLYTMGPMLGHCWELYYAGIYWDKLLHTAGGVMFGLVGLYLFDFLNRGEAPVLLRALFALCFSVALSVFWEFMEYGADCLLHTDMQQDTLVNTIHTYFLGQGPGVTGSLENILSVVVDGVELSSGGYLDIGLIDTMEDMLVETLGAVIVFVTHLIGGGKYRLITPTEKE